MKVLGVLSIQGAYTEHIVHFKEVIDRENYDKEVKVIKVSDVSSLELCDALVIPGGESSAISLTAERTGLLTPLREFLQDKTKPVWGTCAGLILLSSRITNALKEQQVLGGLDIEVKRNLFGRQLDSFVKLLDFSKFIKNGESFPGIFIRAPVVTDVNVTKRQSLDDDDNSVLAPNFSQLSFEEEVEILSELDEKHHNLIVAIKQGNKIGTSFHPELSDDTRFHKWFLEEFVLK